MLEPIAKNATYFDALGLPRAMALDTKEIDRAFREISKKVHPDRFANASREERKLALDHTTFVNDAYRTLKDPQRRAEYLMALEGVPIGKEETTIQDPELLMEMLELQEKLEGERSIDVLEKMRSEIGARKKALLERAGLFFDQHVGTREETVTILHELRFLERLYDRIDGKLEEHV